MSLEVKNLTKKYGDKVVVNNISFSLEKPGVYAFLGTNGAGKTTSLRMMLDMLQKDAGEVLWKSKPLNPLEMPIGYLAEERGLYPKYTIMDQLIYFAKLQNVSKKVALERIEYWSKRLEVEEYIYPKAPVSKKAKKPKPMTADQLSKGNQQKIQLLATLISDPELLILDEPLSGLDPVNSDLFKSIIREQIEADKYLIMSSHQMNVIEEFCEDIIILNHGDAVLQGNLNEIKKSYGRINLLLKCQEDPKPLIEEAGLKIVVETPDGIQVKVKNDEEATALLKKLVEANILVIRFELREPSLHEIFVEKAGE